MKKARTPHPANSMISHKYLTMQKYENIRRNLNDPYVGSKFEGQVKRAFREFYKEPLTMLQVEVRTSIMRANICRYVGHWKKKGVIFLVKKDKCPISKMTAGFYSTNPNYSSIAQLQIFVQ